MKRDRAQKSQAAQTHGRMKTDHVHNSLTLLIKSYNNEVYEMNSIPSFPL